MLVTTDKNPHEAFTKTITGRHVGYVIVVKVWPYGQLMDGAKSISMDIL